MKRALSQATIKHWLIIAMLLVTVGIGGGHAARQGDLGPTSTATARITLRILPRDHAYASFPDEKRLKGHSALLAWCDGASALNHPASLFTASVANTTDNQATREVESLLRASCQDGTPPQPTVSTPAVNTSRDRLTLLISPI